MKKNKSAELNPYNDHLMIHILHGRVGKKDNVPIAVGPGESVTEFQFVLESGHLGYGIGSALKSLRDLDITPSQTGLELFMLSVMVYAADTRISRKTESQDNWTREIKLVLPVLEPQLWNDCIPILETTLNFLTGDIWRFEFRDRPAECPKAMILEPDECSQSAFTSFSLFSGGLDSLIGAVDQLEKGECPLFVSHAGDGAASKAQEQCLQGLEPYQEIGFGHLHFWLQIKKGLIDGVGNENTTRSRSFLFIAAAIMGGSGTGRNFELRIPENGLIALNIPLDPNRVGSLSTRTTHPFYLARWKEIVNRIGIPATITNPYWDQTKGEMVENCRNHALLRSLIPESMSCSSPNKGRWKKIGTQHCGHCLPCIIRRAAILHGFQGTTPDPTTYTLADFNGTLDTRQAIGKQARSFQLAIERLKTNPDLARLLVLKSGPLHDVDADRTTLANVYLRSMLEVGELLKSVTTAPLK